MADIPFPTNLLPQYQSPQQMLQANGGRYKPDASANWLNLVLTPDINRRADSQVNDIQNQGAGAALKLGPLQNSTTPTISRGNLHLLLRINLLAVPVKLSAERISVRIRYRTESLPNMRRSRPHLL